MKRNIMVLFIVVMALFLISGCVSKAGLTVEVDPDPIVFTNGQDLIEAMIEVTTTGMGELTIDGFSVMLTGAKGEQTINILTFDTQDGLVDFQPIEIPFSVAGQSKSFAIQEYLAEKFGKPVTVNTLIEELPDSEKTDYQILTYEDLKQFDSYLLKINIYGSNPVTKEVDVILE